MSYNKNIPLVTDPTSQSFYQIRANFQSINNVFGNNHVDLTKDSSIAGKHNVMVFRPQGSDPTTSATQVALYNKIVTAVPELFFRPNSNQTPIQMTYPSISTGHNGATPPVYLVRQYSFVAGPFVIYGGILKAITSGTVVNLLPSTTLIHVDLILANVPSVSPNTSVAAVNITGNSFTPTLPAFYGSTPVDIYYTAVGV